MKYDFQEKWSNLGHGKLGEVMERSWKVMEFQKLKRVRTLNEPMILINLHKQKESMTLFSKPLITDSNVHFDSV